MTLDTVWQLLSLIGRGLPTVFWHPQYLLIFWGVTGFVYYQYRQTEEQEKALFDRILHPAWKSTLTSLAYGLAGGIAGSILFVFLGVTLAERDLLYVWPLALLLMFLSPRLICFAYAGGFISLVSLLFGWPGVHVGGLLALIGILHWVEGLIVAVRPAESATPVYVDVGDGSTVGGFTIKQFWPIPVMVILAVSMSIPSGAGIEMPDWWPLISPVPDPEAAGLNLIALPVVAALGYGDIALTTTPSRRSRQTARGLLVYGAVLLALAVFGTRWPFLLWVGALFSPIGHEWMAEGGTRDQILGQPRFVPPEYGVMVLDVLPDTPAEGLGLAPGDVIKAVNGEPVSDREAFDATLKQVSFYLELEVETEEGRQVVYEDHQASRYSGPFGVIPVPEPDAEAQVTLRGLGVIDRWLRRFWGHKDD